MAAAGKPSASKLGRFLVHAQFQGSVHSSALFLTAAAQNLLCLKLAGAPVHEAVRANVCMLHACSEGLACNGLALVETAPGQRSAVLQQTLALAPRRAASAANA